MWPFVFKVQNSERINANFKVYYFSLVSRNFGSYEKYMIIIENNFVEWRMGY